MSTMHDRVLRDLKWRDKTEMSVSSAFTQCELIVMRMREEVRTRAEYDALDTIAHYIQEMANYFDPSRKELDGTL